MVTENLSNDFMAKVLEDAAREKMSGAFACNKRLSALRDPRESNHRIPGQVLILWILI